MHAAATSIMLYKLHTMPTFMRSGKTRLGMHPAVAMLAAVAAARSTGKVFFRTLAVMMYISVIGIASMPALATGGWEAVPKDVHQQAMNTVTTFLASTAEQRKAMGMGPFANLPTLSPRYSSQFIKHWVNRAADNMHAKGPSIWEWTWDMSDAQRTGRPRKAQLTKIELENCKTALCSGYASLREAKTNKVIKEVMARHNISIRYLADAVREAYPSLSMRRLVEFKHVFTAKEMELRVQHCNRALAKASGGWWWPKQPGFLPAIHQCIIWIDQKTFWLKARAGKLIYSVAGQEPKMVDCVVNRKVLGG